MNLCILDIGLDTVDHIALFVDDSRQFSEDLIHIPDVLLELLQGLQI